MSERLVQHVDTFHLDGPPRKRQGYFIFKGNELIEAKEYTQEQQQMRTFDTGATRDSEDGKLDYDGFLSPLTLRRYAEYMHKHRKQSDGKIRASDNWQKGIPLAAYMKSLWRHLIQLWANHRNPRESYKSEMEDALCAIIFNASGYLHELLKETGKQLVIKQDRNWLNLPQPTIQEDDTVDQVPDAYRPSAGE